MVDRSGGLWAVTFLILGLFVATTVITPSIMPDGSAGTDEGAPTRAGIDYRQPALAASPGAMDEGKGIKMVVSAQPDRAFLEEGGNWAWAFSLEGGGLVIGDATIRYEGDGQVGWVSAPGSGTLSGYGQRFMQGPSSAMSAAGTEIEVIIYKPGSYTLRIWIMDQEAMGAAGPPSPASAYARSAEIVVPLTVRKALDPKVDVAQSLVGPSGEQELNRYINLRVTDRADRGDTDWDGSVVDYIAIEKDGIKASDVTGRAGSAIVWEEQDDRLVGKIKTTEPYSSRIPRTTWTTSVDLRFATGGEYEVSTWAADGESGEVVSDISSITISVEMPEPDPDPEPEPEPVPDPEPGPVDPNGTEPSDPPEDDDDEGPDDDDDREAKEED